MRVHIGHSDNYLQSIEVLKASKHKALPHISKLISNTTSGYFNRINKVQVENSTLNGDDYNALEQIFHECSCLNEIKINSNHIDTVPCSNLFAALYGKKLTAISFTDNWIGAKLPDNYFEFFTTQKDIFSICFSLNWLGDKGITMFMRSLRKNLRTLELSCNDFYLEGMIAIRNFVRECNFLSLLDISYNLINAKLAEQIAYIINESTSLACLKANSNQLGDKGALLIADALIQNNTITTLNISDNKISLVGAQYLIDGAMKNGTLKQLDLRQNSLNPEEIKKIIYRSPGDVEILA
jgi:Ran GTPase-activating protein (RanGAP) involved in mRNA processing and transport